MGMLMSDQYIYGMHAVAALLKKRPEHIKVIFAMESRNDPRLQVLLAATEQHHIHIEYLSSQKMQARFGEYVHQGLVACAQPLPAYSERDLKTLLERAHQPCLILILDGITDPHNLGACLRSADAAGVDFVVIPKAKNASITPVVSKVACGAAETIPIVRVTNLARALQVLKQEGVWIYGAAGEATSSLYDLDGQVSVGLVMGAEGEGLRRLTREYCDELFALPMAGMVSSLNVSVAAGISLYEIVRQRLNPPSA